MIRHATKPRTISAVTDCVHRSATIGCLVACPGFPLVPTARLLRTVTTAVHLAAVAASTDKNWTSAQRTKKTPARGIMRRVDPTCDICAQPYAIPGRSICADNID